MQTGDFSSVVKSVAAFAVGLLLSIPAHQVRAQEMVRIGVGVDPVFTAWWIAEEKGFYKKHGIKADITQFSGGPALADATMAGEVDIGSSGTATWMPRIVRGSMVVLATMATSPDALPCAPSRWVKFIRSGRALGRLSEKSSLPAAPARRAAILPPCRREA
jgi:ABC-type nitrate/sulfonate/bicarbonate transport system substrate-binding protein